MEMVALGRDKKPADIKKKVC